MTLLNPLDAPEPAWTFKSEALESNGAVHIKRGPRNKAARNIDDTAGLAALKRVELNPDDPASALLGTLQNFAIYSPNTPALRGTVPDPQMRAPLGLAGGGLAAGFESLTRQLGEDTLEEVLELIDWVSEVGVTADATRLLSPSVSRSEQVLKFTDRFMAPSRNTLSGYDASEGALYVLFAAVLCLSPASPGLFSIDNIDSALNPRLVTRLVSRLSGWLSATDPDRQLLFTAHNPSVLDGLDLEDDEVRLFAVERNSHGHTVIRRIEISEKLKALSENYPLSRLWAMGHLGAVPNV